MITEENYIIFQKLISARYKFAKSMPKTPHHYTLRKTWDSDDLFDEVVMAIREYGYDSHFYKKVYQYIDINGHSYWTMGAPIPETILINRAEKKAVEEEYDKIADDYDSYFRKDEYEKENKEVFGMILGAGNVYRK